MPVSAADPASSPAPTIAAHGCAATSAARGSSALPSTATAACAPAVPTRTGPPSCRNRPPRRRSAQPAPSATTANSTAVGSSGRTLNGWPASTSGIWCAASQSGMAAAKAPSNDRPSPAVQPTAAAAGTRRA